MTAVDQLRDELARIAERWGVLVGASAGEALAEQANEAARGIVILLLDDGPATLDALRAVLGPREPAWYSTSLGRLVAPHWLGESVPVGFAAKMLGVSTGRIHQLLGEGKLLRMDGGVSVQSILDRMEWFDAQK